MNTRVHGKHAFECDDCAAVLETEQRDWHAALNVFREAGWQSTNVGAGYEHRCLDCRSGK